MNKLTKVVGRVVGSASAAYSSLYLVSAAAAQSASDLIGGIDTAGQGALIPFIKDALNLVISLSALIAVGILVYSGIQYILASGDEAKIEKATKGITYAIIGLIIAFVAVLIFNFVLDRLLS